MTHNSTKHAFSRQTPVWIITLAFFFLCSSYSSYSQCNTSIQSNFNGTAIPAGRYIWFNAHFKVKDRTGSPTILNITNGHVTFSANGTNYDLSIPKSVVTISTAFSSPTYTFDEVQNTWNINIPDDENGDIFFAGLAFQSPGLPGGISPVNWTTDMSTNQAGVTIDWQWSAAVYTSFSTDYDALNVNPVDQNGKQAGAPLAYQCCAVGGARGGGSGNLTGSNSSTGHNAPCICVSQPGSISGMIWQDLANPVPNGIRDGGEVGIANVTVRLFNSSNTQVGMSTTNGNGAYSFNNIAAGSGYTVQVSNPLGYDFTQKNAAGSTSSNNSDINPGTGRSDQFSINGCAPLAIDAGLICNICGPTAAGLGNLWGNFSGSIINLKWSTISEVNLGGFDIERSSDGINFTRIGTVMAIGNSSSKTDYTYNDRQPVNGSNYYRVKAIDKNAPSHVYSNVITLRTEIKGITMSVAPNPFRDKIQVTINADVNEMGTFKIHDINGRVVKTHAVLIRQGSNQLIISDLINLASGWYTVEIVMGKLSATNIITKQ